MCLFDVCCLGEISVTWNPTRSSGQLTLAVFSSLAAMLDEPDEKDTDDKPEYCTRDGDPAHVEPAQSIVLVVWTNEEEGKRSSE